MEYKAYTICYETKDYDSFIKLEGNRPCLEHRVLKIKKSIEKNGYILCPITVNKSFQVIDGQGRIEALRRLNLPVHFVIDPDAGLAECVALNQANTAWTTEDFIYSHIQLGNKSYINLQTLRAEYASLDLETIGRIATGTTTEWRQKIRKGTLNIDDEKLEEIRSDLNLCIRLKRILSNVDGKKYHYLYACIFAIKCVKLDEQRLTKVLTSNEMPPAPSLQSALKAIGDVYNKGRSKQNWVYLQEEYKKANIEKYGWYEKKWANR